MITQRILEAIAAMQPEQVALVAHAAIARGGELGRDFGVELGRLISDDEANFEEGAQWVVDCAEGNAPL